MRKNLDENEVGIFCRRSIKFLLNMTRPELITAKLDDVMSEILSSVSV